MKTILAIDDEQSVRQSYRVMLSEQYHVLLAVNGRDALNTLDKHHVDLILLDLLMPEMPGLELLEHLPHRGDDIPVIVVTATNSVSNAVTAMKRGAREYVIKPFDVDEVLLLVERILNEQREKNELTALRENTVGEFKSIIGRAPSFQQALEMARQAMEVDSTVLITGESGTGKDIIARAIHTGGKRAKGAFVPLSCCAIPPQLFESELFGHEKGAFTGASERRMGKMHAADKGTLFLDEIGEMPLETQAKLLRVLQDGCFYPLGSNKIIEVDVRIICATNRNLPEAIAKNAFRHDLFYRINVLPVEMPPLRQRREDIPPLIAHFIAKHRARTNAQVKQFSPDATAMLCSYAWPGNVREMENMIERILVCNRTRETITPDCLRGIIAPAPAETASALSDLEGLPLEEAVQRIERSLIEHALEKNGFNQSKAADALGTTRRILKYKMDQLGLEGGKE
jgi:DNA-binding NtrC family response regulator